VASRTSLAGLQPSAGGLEFAKWNSVTQGVLPQFSQVLRGFGRTAMLSAY
jgi:hypothetical protein